MIKPIFYILIVLLTVSCNKKEISHSGKIISQNGKINTIYLNRLETPEKALISWYLYAYVNECHENTSRAKCGILDLLNIGNECDPKHINMLQQWFSTDKLAVFKLKKCPNLPHDSAIQNIVEKLELHRIADTISITYNIKGLNNIQEKSWNIEQTDSYIIKNKTLVKVKPNE
ncbi:MAG: hypothetical protein GY931_09020 [Maribacter sp.]|nr:hypothetical protein [Maribacter sp.]